MTGISGELGDDKAGRKFDCILGLSKVPGNKTRVGQLGCSQGGRRLRCCQIIQKLTDRGKAPGAESMQGVHNQLHPLSGLTATGDTAGTVRVRTQT